MKLSARISHKHIYSASIAHVLRILCRVAANRCLNAKQLLISHLYAVRQINSRFTFVFLFELLFWVLSCEKMTEESHRNSNVISWKKKNCHLRTNDLMLRVLNLSKHVYYFSSIHNWNSLKKFKNIRIRKKKNQRKINLD